MDNNKRKTTANRPCADLDRWAPYVVLEWIKEKLAALRAARTNDPSLALDLALAKVRRREALVSLVRARQEVFIGLVGGVHRLSGKGRVRKLDR